MEAVDPRREMLELSDTAPQEALDRIGRLDPDLANDAVVRVAKINALRRIAMGRPGEKSGTDLAQLFSQEDLGPLREALEEAAKLQESDPKYFNRHTECDVKPNDPVDSVLFSAEAVWPGSVQQALGWTRLRYFHGKQLSFAPGLIDRLPSFFRTTVYDFKLKGLPLFKSALAITFNPKSERISIWLLHDDLRHTENVGAAGILGTLAISSDGSYQFVPEGDDTSGQDARNGEATEQDEKQKSIPWVGIAIAVVLALVLFGCVRDILSLGSSL
jgi:hypothetical protein